MLTRHKYEHAHHLDKIRNKEGDIFKCCRKDIPEDPTCTDCCYDTWQDEYKEVIQKYTKADERYTQAKKRLDFAIDKKARFKTWLDELDKAEDIARKICHQLEIIASQTEKIWFNSIKATKAIEYLFCMIRDFYMQVDYLKKRYDELQNCINLNNDPALAEKDKGILKCLTEYYKKLNDVINTRDEIVKQVVDAIRISYLIRNAMSTQDYPHGYNPCDENHRPCRCHDSEKVYYGFKTIICEWYCAFECDEKCKPCEEKERRQQKQSGDDRYLHEHHHSHEHDHSHEHHHLCSDHCELKPVFEFPICNNDYRCELKECYERTEQEVKDREENVKNADKEKGALTACKESLQKAIEAVNPKSRC
jgi:hypothetical protein